MFTVMSDSNGVIEGVLDGNDNAVAARAAVGDLPGRVHLSSGDTRRLSGKPVLGRLAHRVGQKINNHLLKVLPISCP